MKKNNQQLNPRPELGSKAINNQQLWAVRHSCEHVLTQAMLALYPGIKMAMGPATEEGFYFDFDPGKHKISEDDFYKLEAEMKKIIKKDLPFIKKELSIGEARKLFKDNEYKQEWLNEIKERVEKAVVYWTGDEFVDLCSGPHVSSTGKVGPFKLLSIAGAYWRGDERNKMLTRIYGTCFSTQKDLDHYLWQVKEAKKRDHRRLGKELDLFSFHDEGPGFPFWHAKGMIIYNEIVNFWRQEHSKRGYLEVKTPIILNKNLWVKSGHWNHYRKNMYFLKIDKSNYAVKPMNCPGGALIYKTKVHSYRNLPLEVGELGLVHRHEPSGVLHGLFRVRAFTQDDAHIYCTDNQAVEETVEVLDLVKVIYGAFGLNDYQIELSTRPKKFMGNPKMWQKATEFLKKALEIKKLNYQINPGEGAFYGPKIDFHIKDCLGRTWQCGTIQLDFAMPQTLDLTFVGEDGRSHRPIMIHRTILGALERFIGILVEHYGGAFPVWLAPIQVTVIPIADRHQKYSQRVAQVLKESQIRVEVDSRSETMQKRIRETEGQKIPYMLIVGDREIKNIKYQISNIKYLKEVKVSVRQRGEKDLGQMSLEKFVKRIKKEIEGKK